jgi:uncharacterized membrane protein
MTLVDWMKRISKYGVLAAVASVFALMPLIGVRFFESHDSFFHLDRLVLFDNALRQGCLYPRWIQELAYGYGMPLFNYYPPFSYYFAELFTLLGFDFPESVLATFIIGFVLSGIAMFLFANEILGKAPALVAAVAYIYAPYHLLDAYVRGAMPEFLAFVFLPLIYYSILKAEKKAEYYPLISLSYALLILTHSVTAFISTPIILLFVLFRRGRIKPASFLLLGLGLSAFYWAPAIIEIKNINPITTIQYSDHFLYPSQLFEKTWGFGLSVVGPNDGMGFHIGNVHLIFSLLALYLLFKGNKEIKNYIAYFSLVLLISVFLSLQYSKPLWGFIPFPNFIQFPWRFLFLTSFAASFLSASFLTVFEKTKWIKALALLFVIIFILYSKPFLIVTPTESEKLELHSYQSLKEVGPKTTVGKDLDGLLPRDVKGFSELIKKDRVPWPSGTVKVGCNRYLIEKNISEAQKITPPIFYFPGWRVTGDRREIITAPAESGLMTFQVPGGYNKIYIGFEDTWVRKLAVVLSIFSVFILAGYSVRPFLRKRA